MNRRAVLSRSIIVVLTFVLFGALPCPATEAAASPVAEPAVITSAGQSPGALMMQVLARRADVDHRFDTVGDVELLEGAGSLIVVIGSSMKGLGAIGLDLDAEFSRIRTLLDGAKEKGITVVAAHLEGGPRRGSTSDNLSRLAFQYAHYAVVRADGDKDRFFTDLASQYDVSLETVTATADVTDVLLAWYVH